MSTSTRRDAWSLESTAVPGLNGLVVLNPDGTSVSGPGAGTTDVNIVQIDGTVPSLTVDNLNVQLSHLGANPDSVQIGDGTETLEINTDGSINTALNTGTSTNSGTSVLLVSVSVLASNASRKWATIINDGSTQVYISIGAAATITQGIRLNANGGSYTIGKDNHTTEVINAIRPSGSGNVLVIEGA